MRITRSREHRLIAGVCGGLADYLGWSPLLVRILYVVLPFLGVLAYLVLWLLLPEAPVEEEPREPV